MSKFKWTARTYPAGAVAASKAYTIKKHVDDTTVTSGNTSVAGEIDYSANGSVGPIYVSVTDTTPDDDVTRVISSKSAGSGGAYALAELPMALRSLGNGVVDGYLNELAITDPDSGTNLAYATGAAVVNGIPVVFGSSGTHAVVTAQDAANPKACYLVIEVTGLGETEEGKAVLKDVCGAAGASPSLPALTQTDATYQYPLATFRLGIVGASNANDVTTLVDARTFLGQRNPVVSSVARRADPAVTTTTTSTTGEDVTWTSGSTTPTLVSGVTYDIEAHAFLLAKVTAGQTVSIAPYISSTSDIGSYVSSDASSDYVGIGNVHTSLGVVGAGAAISCGLRWKVSGGTGTAITGYLLVICRPRA